MANYQKLLNLVAIVGLQENGKTKVTTRMIRVLVKYHHIMTNDKHIDVIL